MKIKKVLSILLTTSFIATSFIGCGGTANENINNNEEESIVDETDEDNKDIYVGFVTDEGGVNDKSFNQSGWEGVQKAQDEFGITAQYIESSEESEYIENIEAFINQNADLVVACGFKMEDAVHEMALKYPETNFLLVDAVVDQPNVKSVTFAENEGSFLVGVIAGLITENDEIGFMGGYDTPLINKFRSGFAAGVEAVNPEAAQGIIDSTNVVYAESFSDVNKGAEIARSLYNNGVDVIYHAAGGAGIGMFTAAQEIGDVWAIGVDQDQAEALPEYADVIATSMLKKVDAVTYAAVADIINGEFETGEEEMGLDDEAVGIAETTSNNVSDDIIEVVEDYMQQIINGDIVVPSTLEELQ